ncbi:MAG: DUF4185 domain-containing protein [Bacteroidetes bacterium]|nr:DUF4185 domain-containing protein [Bacteroidota bacterium]
MSIKNVITILSFSLLLGCGESKEKIQAATDLTTFHFTAAPATEWTDLFYRKHGWFGADGIFSIPMNGIDTAGANNPETMLLFSDTMLGDIINDSLQPGFKMIHNSVGILKNTDPDKNNLQFYWDSIDGKPIGLFTPKTPHAKKGDYYWLGDGFVDKDLGATYFFAYRVRDTSTAAFGFAEVGNAIIKLPFGSQPPFHDQQQIETPFFLSGTAETYGSFGAGVFPNLEDAGYKNADGYVYVYGVRGKKKEVLVARVLPKDFEQFDKWRFWDGSSWNEDIKKVAAITDRASNELSVSPLPDGRYALIFQTDGLGRSIGLRLSNHPQGPFGPIIKLWDCKEPDSSKNFIVYNAKAHPNLSKPNELLISYNVNSLDFWHDVITHPNLYRPRFVNIKLLP